MFVLALFFVSSIYAAESPIWGKSGERWNKSRIPDFTKAGYKNGKEEIPTFEVNVNIKDFGAVGDGITDDTEALSKAILACATNGAVLIPAGIYLISDTIQISKKGIAIRGEGEQQSTIFFSKGLEELYPKYNGSQTKWSWAGAMIIFNGNSYDVGIENLCIKFPDHPWVGHDFHEKGYNGIGFEKCTNAWVKNVTITGADLGIWIASSAKNITLDHWTLDFESIRNSNNYNGHHGINCYGGYNLFSNFTIKGKFYHDLSVEGKSSTYNVFMQGKGEDLCFDHHAANYDQKYNLFTDIDIGKGSRMYMSGGKLTPRGVSFYETWWNIKSVNKVNWVTSMGVSRNNVIVGVNTSKSSALPDNYNNWLEAIKPEDLVPQNLYLAQMAYMTKKVQSITWTSPKTVKLGDQNINFNCNASSGLEVEYSSSNNNVISIENGIGHIISPGTATITVTQAGNDEYNAVLIENNILVEDTLQTSSISPLKITQKNSFKISPNPANNVIDIKLNKPSDIYIYNSSGAMVYRILGIKNEISIPINQIGNNGVYYVKVKNETQKLIIAHR